MRLYSSKDWISFIFNFHRSDTFMKLLPVMVGLGVYASVIGWLEVEYWQLGKDHYLRNFNQMHNMLGFVISLLLVFRTNTAYDRWWEGRRHWGALVNTSRNLAIKIASLTTDADTRAFFRKTIPNYAFVLNAHLKDEETAKMLFDGLDLEMDHHRHKPNQVAKSLMDRTLKIHRAGQISGEELLFINQEITAFTDICGACERIKNTPIPYSYSAFIKKFIFFYVLTLPFGYAFSLGYLVGPIVVFIFYVLASLELIAEEIEDPFGNDENDLPTQKISENIKKHIEELL